MTTDPAVRAPKQARTRESWERILDTGQRLLEDGGFDALTITEVCRLTGTTPPSLYARVDGLSGLFAAIYDRGMAQIAASEERLFAGLPRTGAPLETQALEAATAIAEVFRQHAALLRPIIGHAANNPTLRRRGATESRRLLDRVAASIDVDQATAQGIAQTLYAECVVRTMYGSDFFGAAEPDRDFHLRLGRIATAMARLAS